MENKKRVFIIGAGTSSEYGIAIGKNYLMNSCIPEKYFTEETLSYIRDKLNQKDDFINLLRKTKWGYYHNNDVLMFHAPVGNINLLKDNKNIEIIISGFCVSPDAGFKFLDDYLKCGNKDYK